MSSQKFISQNGRFRLNFSYAQNISSLGKIGKRFLKSGSTVSNKVQKLEIDRRVVDTLSMNTYNKGTLL